MRQSDVGDRETESSNSKSGELSDSKASDSEQRPTKEQQALNSVEMKNPQSRLAFLSPMLFGYSLKEKKWLSFMIDRCREIAWNDEAYVHLVYPEGRKDLLLSFVRGHCLSDALQDYDVITGKGAGLVVLLSGPPGTGKTLTVEAIADRTRRPLLFISAEDLGTSARHVAEGLSKLLELATEWDALALMDEADVFLSKRTIENIERNELVAIFLQKLEYYRGILFLITNLLANIDFAFRSRMHLHFVYEALSQASRFFIWKKFLVRSAAARDIETPSSLVNVIDDGDMKALAAWNLDGREIKTVVKITEKWCRNEGCEMTRSRIETGIKVSVPQAVKDEE